MRYVGEERSIKKILKTEITTINGKTRYLDFLCELEDETLCHIEFQFPVAYEDDLNRFFDYNIVAEIRYDSLVETMIINFTESDNGAKSINRGFSKEFHPKNVYLGDINYEKILEKIKCNANKNIKLTSKDEIDLMLMSLLPKYTDKTKMLKTISALIKHEKLLNDDKKDIVKSIIQLEIENLVAKENKEEFKGDENMTPETQQLFSKVIKEVNAKYEYEAFEEGKIEGRKEGKIEGREEGKKEGRQEGKKEIAKKLKEFHTPEEIAKITGLTLETIQLL